MQRKREEYFGFIEQYYDSRNEEHHQDTYRQVQSSPAALLLTGPNLKVWFLEVLSGCRFSTSPGSGLLVRDLFSELLLLFLIQ